MRYYISDLHFFHAGLNNRMDKRGFTSVEEMNNYMIEQWNSRVRRNDEVVILGDFSLGKGEETNEILKQLKSKKILILGNHDTFIDDKKFDKSLFQWIGHYRTMNDNKRKVVLSHYPIMTYEGQFRRNEDSIATTWMVHGHVHNTDDALLVEKFKDVVREFPRKTRQNEEPVAAPIQMINCFCMYSDYIPLTLDEWIEKERNGELKSRIRGDWFYDC